jgi:hypothetical protein
MLTQPNVRVPCLKVLLVLSTEQKAAPATVPIEGFLFV